MPAKKKVCFFIVLLLLSGLMCTVGASSDPTVTFHGAGVTIDLTYPEEAHPADSITHNVTITTSTALTMNFTIVIYAPVNSSWQEVRSQTITDFEMTGSNTFTSRLGFVLPQHANGTLNCFLNVSTDVNNDNLSATFYTTRVGELTFSKMQSLYDEMLANYTALQANYTPLLNEYDSLLANYSSLFDNYTSLLTEYNTLSNQYDAQVASYQKLLGDYNNKLEEYSALDNRYKILDGDYKSKSSEYIDLQKSYSELNTTRYSLQGNITDLQGNYTSLQADYDTLNQAYADLQARITRSESALDSDRIVMLIFIVAVAALVALIVYLKWKKQEPYVVIRKETVSVNQDESSEAPS
jgi:predicted nuclease with TOPRIM domain